MTSNVLATRIQQALLAGACWIFSSPVGALDYDPIPLECLAARADAIVRVHLPDKPTQPYRVDVVETLAGDEFRSSDPVFEPATWRGSAPLFFTREVLLFMRRNPDDRRWEVIGPSGEGRVQLDQRYAYGAGVGLPGASWVDVTSEQRTLRVQRVERRELVGAVSAMRRCFTFRQSGSRLVPLARCDATELDRLQRDSALLAFLIPRLRQPQGLHCGK